MIRMLVAVDADLTSSIAVRYACQLANLVKAELQTIHVTEPALGGPATGAGWARRTWERELVRKGRDEISQLLKAESGYCPVLAEPLVAIGDRDGEILNELQKKDYHFFVEGTPSKFGPADLYHKIHSSLYQQMPCAVILVKNLLVLRRTAIVLLEDLEPERLLSGFMKMFQGAEMEFDLISCTLLPAGEVSSRREGQKDKRLAMARDLLAAAGWEPKGSWSIQGSPEELSAYLQDHSLVVVNGDRALGRKSPLLSLLARVPAPLLLFW